MINIKEKLKELGLDDKASEVYLAILQLGKCSVSDIARKTGIKRTTVYLQLEEIVAKNLIAKTTDKKRMMYYAEDPKTIVGLFDAQKRQIDENRKKFENFIPELQSIFYSSFDKPAINFYEGKEGIKQIYKKMLNTHKSVYSFFSPEAFFKLFSFQENDELLMTIYNKGGTLLNLTENSERATEHTTLKDYKKFVKYKYLPESFKFETDLLITGNKIAHISFKNMIGVIIEDQAITDLQKQTFKLLWKTL